MTVPAFCRDCLIAVDGDAQRCPACGSPRSIAHPELDSLTLAHVDCDAFYAAVEKRDEPALADQPVIVGGGRRGVAMTACYVARRYGVRSAMPMFKALELCPHAVVIRPDMEKYARVSRDIRAIFRTATPMVEPVSLDEAYLDLSGTEGVHGHPPARTLAALARQVESEIGITVSIGLSHNKLLAKLASDMDKPRGFGVIGRAEARAVLAARRASVLPGVGPKLSARLAGEGLVTIADLQTLGEAGLQARLGEMGRRLWALANGQDSRAVVPDRPTKSISAETTFDRDLRRLEDLEHRLWPLCEEVSARLKKSGIAGHGVTVKLKTAQFRIITRQTRLDNPTQLAETIFAASRRLLERELGARTAESRAFRLIGVGVADLVEADVAPAADLFAAAEQRRQAAVEQAIDELRERFGEGAVMKGRSLPRGRG